jgi:hypothetical protein
MATRGGQQTIRLLKKDWTKSEQREYRQDWVCRGKTLAECLEGAQWKLGEWLIEGQANLSDAYDEAEKITGLARATLMDIKGTADCFDGSSASRRREGRLSWSHHKELKRLKKDEQALQEMKENATRKNWSVQDLREKVDRKLNAGKSPASARSIPVEVSLYGRLQNLATQQGVDIKKLVADALSAYLDQQSETAELEELVVQ